MDPEVAQVFDFIIKFLPFIAIIVLSLVARLLGGI